MSDGHGKTTDHIAAINRNGWHIRKDGKPVTSRWFFFYLNLRSPIFLSRLFALTKQLRPSLYLSVAAITSNRVRTKILELIGVKLQISSKYNFKNLRNYLHISNIFCTFALDFKSVLFPVWSNRLNPATAST